jgi:hypothetical protein
MEPPQSIRLDSLLHEHGSVYFTTEYYEGLDEKTREYLESEPKYSIRKKDFGVSISFSS